MTFDQGTIESDLLLYGVTWRAFVNGMPLRVPPQEVYYGLNFKQWLDEYENPDAAGNDIPPSTDWCDPA